MKCTRCNIGTLKPSYIDDLLPGHICDHCQGNWLYLTDYLRWLDKDIEESPVNPDGIIIEKEKHEVMLCPKTGSVMLKYRISKQTDHRLDLSPSVNGIWMDKGEWKLLKREGLNRSLNRIFTDPWQRNIRMETTYDTFDTMYENEFGQEDYTKLKEIREWLDSKENHHLYLAYLTSNNPYSTEI